MSTNLARKITSVAFAFATVVFVSGSAVPFASAAMTQAEMLVEIERLMDMIAQLRGQLGQGSPVASCEFNRDLTVGMRGDDVKCLQDYLTSTGDFTYAGGSTGTFGPVTRAAVSAWQRANSVSPTAGYFGSRSKAKYMSLVAAGTPTPTPTPTGTGTPTPTPVGSGLTVSLPADQPAGSLAPYNGARIPFTKLALTAGNDGEVTVTGIVVQRTGLAADAALDSVMLLDENGNQLGLKKTLNSEHRATVGETMRIAAGATKYVIIAATRAAAGSLGGQNIAVSAVGVNVSGSTVVNGTFPMTGATHTVNETLVIGLVTMARGSYDPGSSVTKNLGETGYTFAGVRITAGSAEKVYIKSIRWNQTGSAGSGDIANVKTIVDGTAYDTVLSADGKYYTTTLPGSGVLMDKGFSKDVSVKGDIAGGSARTIDFDIAKRTDLFLVGENFGYGIVPPQTGLTVATADSASFSSSEDPWYDSAQVTVSAGTVTVSSNSATPPANVAINLNNQILGGWTVDVKGEPVQVSSLKVNVNVTQSGGSAGGADDVTNAALYDASGRTLAGPLDVNSTALAYATVTFTDTITFPVGVTSVVMKGKLGTGFANNDTVAASTTPSTWTSTGQTSGNTVTPSPSTAITSNSMTVKSLAMTISLQTTPGAQSVVGGAQDFEMARYTFNASQSGEDAKMASVPLAVEFIGGTTDKISGCQLYDGAAATAPVLTTGSNVVDPTASGSSTTFTFDTPIIVTKGTSKTLSLRCDFATVADSALSYQWGINSASSFTVTGVTSGQSITDTTVVPAANDSSGNRMTLTTGGSYTVVDDGTDGYTIVTPGQEVTLAKLRFTASIEDIDIRRVALRLSGTASNTPKDLLGLEVRLYDAANPATVLATATFVNEGDTATSTEIATGAFRVAKGSSNAKTLLVKGTIADISDITGGNAQLTASGDLLIVDYDGNAVGLANGNYGVGAAGNISGPTTSTSLSGVRIVKARPVFTKLTLPSNTITGNGVKSVYRFSVKAEGGPVDIYKFRFLVGSSTVTATTSLYSLYAWTSSGFSGQIGAGWPSTGLLNGGNCYNGLQSTSAKPISVSIYMDKTGCNQATTTLKIPINATYYFDLQTTFATIETGTGSESVTFQLEGDTAFPTVHQGVTGGSEMGKAGVAGETGVASDTNSDFIWSPNSTTSATVTNFDFTNGFNLPGLPTSNMTQESLSTVN